MISRMINRIIVVCVISFTAITGALQAEDIRQFSASGADSLNMGTIGLWEICNTYAVACDAARDLAFVGIGGSVIILDITDPASPQELGTISTLGLMRDFSHGGDHLYAADWDFGLRVFSIADPSDPVTLGSLQLEGLLWGIDVVDETAYLACGDRGIKVVSLAEPGNPVQIGETSIPGYATNVAVVDTFAVVTEQNSGLRIFSVSDPALPREIGAIDLAGTSWDVVLAEKHAFVAVGGSGLEIVSLSDPANPIKVGSYNTTGFSRGIGIAGDRVYLANGGSGIRVISVEDKANPEEIGFYDTIRYTWDVAACDTLIFAGDGEGGIRILRFADPVAIGNDSGPGMHVPRSFSLSQNYPNPFNPTTTIRLTVPEDCDDKTVLTIYDVRGRQVTTLVDRLLPPGEHSVVWNGRNANGEPVRSGTYLFTLDCGWQQIVRKMNVLK